MNCTIPECDKDFPMIYESHLPEIDKPVVLCRKHFNRMADRISESNNIINNEIKKWKEAANLLAKELHEFKKLYNDKQIDGWFCTTENPPKEDGRYLVYEHRYNWVGVSSLRNGKWDGECTYWMPLPKPRG